MLAEEETMSLAAVRAYLHQPMAPVTTVHVGEIALTYFDELLPEHGCNEPRSGCAIGPQ